MAKSCVCVKCGHCSEQPHGLKPAQKNKEDKGNPFAEQGRDKLLELKAEVDEKKQKILKAIGEDEVVMVRFTYTDDNRLKPIIIKEKSKKSEKEKVASVEKTVAVDYANDEKKQPVEKMQLAKLNVQVSHAYLAAVLILILLLVALLKRQAQLCSSSGVVATR